MAERSPGPVRGPFWLVRNAASGSNDAAALAALEDALAVAGLVPARQLCFPEEPAPDAATLRAAGVATLAVFAGDGTVHGVVAALHGWEGRVLVLPGGTMNLLSRRLHGAAGAPEIVARLGQGAARVVRPGVIRWARGESLTGILVGPGTYWNSVREALRERDVLEILAESTQAINQSATGTMVELRDPACGRDGGYAAILVTPGPDGLVADGYFAATLADYARHAVALLRRNFRDGPHERFAVGTAVEVASRDASAMGLLVDGEPFEGGAAERFTLAPCAVDLIATAWQG